MHDEISRSSDKRAAELKWLHDNQAFLWEHYAGQWICVQGDQMVSYGRTSREAIEAAKRKGFDSPLVSGVRKRDYQKVILVRRT